MSKLIPLQDSRRLARRNASTHRELSARHEALQKSAQAAQAGIGEAYSGAYTGFLVPFAASFDRLKNADLGELTLERELPELAVLTLKLRSVGIGATEALGALVGGGAAGAAAGAATFSAVGAFATASTGTAISSLSGAAATSSTLAWLGGGSVATGGAGVAGGTTVLAGIVAAPVLVAVGGLLYWKSAKTLGQQKRCALELRDAAAQLEVDEERVGTAAARLDDAARVTSQLAGLGQQLLPDFQRLVETKSDYALFTGTERALVAQLTALAQAASAVIACPLMDSTGEPNLEASTTLDMALAVAEQVAA